MCGQKSSAVHTRRQQQLVHRTEKGLNRTGNMPLGCLAVLNHIPGHDGRRKPPAQPRLKCWQRSPAHLYRFTAYYALTTRLVKSPAVFAANFSALAQVRGRWSWSCFSARGATCHRGRAAYAAEAYTTTGTRPWQRLADLSFGWMCNAHPSTGWCTRKKARLSSAHLTYGGKMRRALTRLIRPVRAGLCSCSSARFRGLELRSPCR